ncbi:MAG: MerR family transcriptional regulator [Chloroflexota bacterium]
MFRIGEFSQIAQVSGHLLRHYDDIGLLKPAHVDEWTSYRYYSAHQLADLNRIMALKDLGLSLDDIGAMMSDNVSPNEMRSLLTNQKSKIEQMIQAEMARLARVEARLNQLENKEADDLDIVVKSIPTQPYLSTNCRMRFLDDGPDVVRAITNKVGSAFKSKQLKQFTAIFPHDNYQEEDVDLEVGFVMAKPTNKELEIENVGTLAMRELPEVEEMATVVQHENHHILFHVYEGVGKWVEDNNCQISGPIRKLYITPPDPENKDRALVELQFPIQSSS